MNIFTKKFNSEKLRDFFFTKNPKLKKKTVLMRGHNVFVEK